MKSEPSLTDATRVSDERNPRSLSALYVHPSYRGPKGAEGGHSRRVMNGERERIMSETDGETSG